MRPMGRRDCIHPDMGGNRPCGMEEGGTTRRPAEDIGRISREAEMTRAEERFDAADEAAEAHIHRMPDGSPGIRRGSRGALPPRPRIPAGRHGGRPVPAICPGRGPETADMQGTDDLEEGGE